MKNNKQKEFFASEFKMVINWWERKRLLYNIITLFGGLAVIFLRSEVPNGISSFSEFGIIFFWLFGANIFYTFGWALEALLNYYLKTPYWGNGIRRILFVLGLLFSFFWMFLLTAYIP